jgi:very-short-patch-repair endonuclease
MPHGRVPPKLRANARRMRKAMTDAEVKLWNELRAHRLTGLGFRRQMPVVGYIADFACPEHRLIVEVDGSQHGHGQTAQADLDRTAALERAGWQVLRFWNHDILCDIDGVCTHILRAIGKDRE